MGYQRRVHGRGTAINIGCTRSVLLEIMNSLAVSHVSSQFPTFFIVFLGLNQL